MHNPFKSLEKDPRLRSRMATRKRQLAAQAAAQTRGDQERQQSATDDDAFLQAVSDVEPLHGSGRRVAAVPVRTAEPPTAPTFARLVAENIAFEMEHTHEYMTGQIAGLDPKICRKLRAGAFSVQAHLDLHGMNADQAKLEVITFVRRCYMEGKRCVLLIPGRGRNSPLGQGILRLELSSWLTQAPLKRIILAFATAQPRHGGSGAVYLLLRQVRKEQGKVAWEDIFADLAG